MLLLCFSITRKLWTYDCVFLLLTSLCTCTSTFSPPGVSPPGGERWRMWHRLLPTSGPWKKNGLKYTNHNPQTYLLSPDLKWTIHFCFPKGSAKMIDGSEKWNRWLSRICGSLHVVKRCSEHVSSTNYNKTYCFVVEGICLLQKMGFVLLYIKKKNRNTQV